MALSDNRLTVWVTSRSRKNPYYDLLIEALEDHEVSVLHTAPLVFLPLTRQVLRKSEIDVIHIDWTYSFWLAHDKTFSSVLDRIITAGRLLFFCIDIILIRLIGPSLLWTVHNKFHHEKYYHRFEVLLNILLANVVDVVAVKCEAARAEIADSYRIQNESKMVVIPDGNYLNVYKNDIGRESAREKLDVGDEFVFLFFGLIRPYKGVRHLIEQFESLDDEDLQLMIVGNPRVTALGEEIRAKAEVNDRISTRLEYIPDREVQLYMNAADVLVLPYQRILNSGSVYLGLSFGKPIIAPEMGCIPEVMPDDELLYDPAEQDGLKERLRAARTADLSRISEANFRRAKSYTWSDTAEQYAAVYADIV